MIRGALRRCLWFTVISAFAYGSGMTIAVYVRITWQRREREKKREKKRGERKKEEEKCVEVGRHLAWLCLCTSRHIRDHLWPCSVSLSFSHSPPFLCSAIVLFRRSSWLASGRCLRCANDRAADIGNYSLWNSRASPSPPLSLSFCAFVSYCPSLSFPPPSSFPTFYLSSSLELTRRRAYLPLVKDYEAATSIYKCCHFCCVTLLITGLKNI